MADPPPDRGAPHPTAPSAAARWWVRWWDRRASPRDSAGSSPSGYLCDGGPERLAWLVAVGLALAAAIAFEWISARTPIPPGGDEGTWLLLAYPYVGIAAPTSVHLFSYPPLSLPLLGLAVGAAGGPVAGARLFVGAVLVALGLAAYQLGHAMFRWRAVALLFEAALLAQPDFQQLQYFGAYPNLFGFVFLFLAVAFGLRYLRSRRDLHLALFWGTATAALLSHALVAVVLLTTVGIAALALLYVRRFPRGIFATWTGRIGAGAFTGLGLLYYAGSWLTNTPRPNYLYTTVLTPSQSTLQLGEVFHAFYLEPVSVLVHAGAFAFTYQSALILLWGLSGLLVAALLVTQWRRPRWVSDRVIVLVAWFLAVFVVALVTWYLNLTADYRRFTYFLYPANLLVIALAGDLLLSTLRSRLGSDASAPPSARRSPFRPRPETAVAGVLAVAVGILAVGAAVYTVPAAVGFDNQDSHSAHGSDFLDAMRAIADSGISGAIFSVTPVVDRWPAALTGHDLYEVRPPTGYTYTANSLQTDELAALTASYRDVVTDGQVLLAVPGTTPTTLNATPLYGEYVDGIARDVFQIVPASITAELVGGGAVSVAPTNGAVIGWIAANATSPSPTLLLNLSGPGLAVTVALRGPANGGAAQVVVSARVAAPNAVSALRFNVTAAGAGVDGARPVSGSEFEWDCTANDCGLPTFVSLSSNATGFVPNATVVAVSVAPAAPAPDVSVSLSLTSPGTSNPVTTGLTAVDTPLLWQQWGVRFVLLWNGTTETGAEEATYLSEEYGTSVLATDGAWTVLLWPATAGGQPPNEAGSTYTVHGPLVM